MANINRRAARRMRRHYGLKVYHRGARIRGGWGSRFRWVYRWRRKHKPHHLIPRQRSDTCWQHVTVTNPSGHFRADCRVIERIGMDRFGSGCSYNIMVDMRLGHIGLGQPFDAKGTHTINTKGIAGYSFDQNAVAIAIAVVGMCHHKLSPRAEEAIARIKAACIDVGILTTNHDYEPHSLVAAKECPCDETRNKMRGINRRAVHLSKRKEKPQPLKRWDVR